MFEGVPTMSNSNILRSASCPWQAVQTLKGHSLRPARIDGRHWPSGRRQFSVPRARLHCEHDGEYCASRVRKRRTYPDCPSHARYRTLGFSCRGDTGRTGHGRANPDSQIRFAAQAFLLEVAFLFAASFCAIGYRGDLSRILFNRSL